MTALYAQWKPRSFGAVMTNHPSASATVATAAQSEPTRPGELSIPKASEAVPAATRAPWFIKRCDIFAHLEANQLEALERQALVRRFAKGQMVYMPSDPGLSVLVLTKGRVKLKGITPEGKEVILAFIDEGEVFGEMAVVDEADRGEFAEAVVPCEVLALPRDEVLAMMNRVPETALRITRLVGTRRRRIESRLRAILFRPHRERVASLLMELLESHGAVLPGGSDEEGPWAIKLRLSHQEMAGLIGATRETVTLMLGQLQLEGLIQVKRRSITIVNRQGLAKAANP